ncbi:hypothetical protein IY230_01395, partial [Acholeplasma laidlawii]|uniref:MBG domain-containing protein n=1 Tax=Acholeplasma laidlawii TaxID=2148 RepID=UPI0018C31A8D
VVLTRAEGEDVGSYVISVDSMNAANFNVEVNEVTLEITQRTLVITPNVGQTKVYDGTNIVDIEYDVFNLANNDDETVLKGSLSIGNNRNVGTYAINIGTLDGNPNYVVELSDEVVMFEIITREISIKAKDLIKTYGDQSDFDYEVIGLDPVDSFVVHYNLSSELVGENTITITSSLDLNNNYEVNYIDGTMKIDPRYLNLSFIGLETVVYGNSYIINPNTNDLVFSDRIVISNHSNRNVNEYVVGKDDITILNINDEDITNYYVLDITNFEYSIVPAVLTINAFPQTVVYGTLESEIEKDLYSVTGFKYEENKDLITGELMIDEFIGSVGTYDILQGSLNAGSNYTISFRPSILIVEPKQIIIDIIGNTNITYGDIFDLEGIISGANNILTDQHIELEGYNKNVGTHEIVAKVFEGSLDVSNNYEIINGVTYLRINKKELVVTISDSFKTFGEEITSSLFASNVAGFIEGDNLNNSVEFANGSNLIYQTDAEDLSVVGEYLIWISSGYVSSNYKFTYVIGTLTVTPATLRFETSNNNNIYDATEKALTIKTFDPTSNEEVFKDFVITYNGSISLPVNAGTYNVNISFAGDDMYGATAITRTLVIERRV